MIDVDARSDDGIQAGVQIPIEHLTSELVHMRAGGVYWVCVCADDDAMAFSQRMLAQASGQAKVAVVGDEDFSGLLQSVPPDQGPADTRFYQLEGRLGKALGILTDDLERVLRPRGRTILVLIRAAGLGQHMLERLLDAWKLWLRGNGCTMLVVSRGAETFTLARQLEPMNDALSGLAILDAGQGAAGTYQVVHWRNGLGVRTGLALPLLRHESLFQVDDAAQWQHPAGTLDENRVFLDSDIFHDSAFTPPAEWHVCEGWQALRICGMVATGATLVFALTEQSDLIELAGILHELRRTRGRRMKLVVRVMHRPLRYQDEQMLLDCGATIVVPADVKPPGLLSLLEAVQGQVYVRTLMADIGQFRGGHNRRSHASGALPAEDFVRLLDDLLTRQDASVSAGVLIQLMPAPGLSARQALTQLQLRRGGDVACHAEGMVCLFLEGCRAAWVKSALQQVFLLPVAELFAKYRIYDTTKEIRWQIKALEEGLERGAEGVESQARHDDPTTSMDGFVDDEAGRVRRAAPPLEGAGAGGAGHLQPRLMALRITGKTA